MKPAIEHLRNTLNQYFPITDEAWQSYFDCCSIKQIKKGTILYAIGVTPKSFSYIHQGLIRAYVIDEDGNEYNKNFFSTGRFPGCMTALLKQEPSKLEVQALEDCEIIEIDHQSYRKALFKSAELMKFHINYLEAHWLLEKEPKEIGYLQYEAKARYQTFLTDFEEMLPRLAQFHIASYLGITPTQLSRIKKERK